MPKFAGHINVDARLFADHRPAEQPNEKRIPKFSLTIDGEEFPWFITEDGVSAKVNNLDVPCITITIPADRVTFDHGIRDTDAETAQQ